MSGIDGAALVTVPVPALGSGAVTAPGARVGVAERFGAFGEPLAERTPRASDGVPILGWQQGSLQQTLVGTSSVTLMGARPYHPALGEFLAPDPLVDSGPNPYTYANGDPINESDTSGNESSNTTLWSAIGAVAGIALAFGGGYIAGNFTGVKRMIGAAMVVGSVAGTVASTYIAVSSATEDQSSAITIAVVAGVLAVVSAGIGFSMSSGKVAALAEHRALQNPDGIPWTDAMSPLAEDNAAGTLARGQAFREWALARDSDEIVSLFLPQAPAAPAASATSVAAHAGGVTANRMSSVASSLSGSVTDAVAPSNAIDMFARAAQAKKLGLVGDAALRYIGVAR
jgi:RHS repeat-associated protein